MPKMKYIIPLSEDEIKKTPIAEVRKKYTQMAEYYTRVIDRTLLYCPKCDDFRNSTYDFYEDRRFPSGCFPYCKECMKKMALDYNKKEGTYSDNKEKTIEAFRLMDLPFIEALYDESLARNADPLSAKSARGKTTAYQELLAQVKSLPQYRGQTFKNSELLNNRIFEGEDDRQARPEIKKVFGDGLTESDYLFLQDQYDDWYARVQIDSKAQETLIVQICFCQLNLWKAQKQGRDSKSLVDSLNNLMDSANLKPKQNAGNASSDTLSYGQQIEKLEMTRPVSEPSEEFKDVDGIMKYISTWFLGHIAKAFGLNNIYSRAYDEEIKKYTVEPPNANEEGNSKEIRQRLFGKDGE